MIHPSKQWPNFYMALTETWQCKFPYVNEKTFYNSWLLSLKINPELVLDTMTYCNVPYGYVLIYQVLSSVHWFKTSWFSIYSNTCFDHDGCQQGDETGSRLYGLGRTLLISKCGSYIWKSSLPKWRHRYSSKRAGNLNLWTSPHSSVTHAF